jgi:Mannitol dehydrogenase Rossmann domain/Mannitol dehydrogenase C-terminal domain
VTQRLCAVTLECAAGSVQRPGYDFKRLRTGLVHLGVGAFHRAHQASFTEDAILAEWGDWGVTGISLRHPYVADALRPQDCLYTVETLSDVPQYRIIGVIRRALAAMVQPAEALAALAAPEIHLISLTVTEKGYNLAPQSGLDESHPDIVHDLEKQVYPRSTIGWLVHGLSERRRRGSGPVTVLSCDNLAGNGRKLEAAVLAFAARRDPHAKGGLARWIGENATFPRTMVDCIVPATTEAGQRRIAAALGLRDEACVSREPFAQWVIEDRFKGPRPAWEKAGALLMQNGGAARLAGADVVYLSGVSLAILPNDEARAAAIELLWSLKDRVRKIAFDSNLRPALWRSQKRDSRSDSFTTLCPTVRSTSARNSIITTALTAPSRRTTATSTIISSQARALTKWCPASPG